MKISQSVVNFFAKIFGHFSWSAPLWLIALKRYLITYPLRFFIILFSFAFLLFATIYSYHWYKHLPQPVLITAHITIPAVTPNEEELTPQPLTIDFGLEGDEFSPKSVATLDAIGKQVSTGIQLSPTVSGSWSWESGSHLVFTPDHDWPAGQEYTITFDKSIFAAQTKLEKYDYIFTTRPFRIKVTDFKFYQDPINVKERRAVATVSFNYPVITDSFENNTTLTLQGVEDPQLKLPPQGYKFSVSYDANKRTAYLRSENLSLPEVQRYLMLSINPGVKPVLGPSVWEKKLQKDIIIPDIGSYFKVTQSNATVVYDDQNKPEQVLNLETTVGVNQAELTKSLHVYLLPKDYPATTSEEAKLNYQWQSASEVTPAILTQSTLVNLQAIPADRDYATLHSFRFSAPPSRFLYVKLDQGTHAFGDYLLTTDYATLIKAPEYPKQISFLHKGALLALDGEKKLSIVVRGVPAVKINFARVLPDNVNQLITQTNGTFSEPSFINDNFNQNNISQIFSEIRTFETSDPAKAQYLALDIGKYLAAKQNINGPQGLFLLQMTGWDPQTNQPLDIKANRLILVTNLGFFVKDNYDSSHDIFVQSITTGKPAAAVNVSVLGKNGLPYLTKATDAQGHVNFPSLKDYTNEREPTAYLASQGTDVAFIPYLKADRQLNYTRFNTGGLYTQEDQQTLSAFVFSDRGIYRPGDTAHIGFIVKKAYVQPEEPGLPLEAVVVDPRGMTVLDQQLSLIDTNGYFTLDFPTRDSTLTGAYTVNLYIVKDDHEDSLLGSTTIQLAEFLPDRMRISAVLSAPVSEGWISPTDLSATVGLQNLYGTAASGRKVEANIILAPQAVTFPSLPDYTFADPLFDEKNPPKVYEDTLVPQETNAQGNANFNLNLERFAKSTYKLTLFAEGFEAEGGRSVTTQVSTLVSPLAYLVGYKTDGDMRFIKQDAARSVNFIAVNPQLKQIGLSNLKLQLIALRPVSTLVKNADGTYQYQSIIQTSVVNTTPFTISEQGINQPLNTQQIGDFALRVLDQNETELSRINYSIVGASQLALAKNAELSVKLNKESYQPGDTIQLQITSPYTGSGLISIERDKVYTYQWFTANSTTSLQTIQLPADFKGNGYVNVTFVRDWNSPDIFMNPLSYSVTPFSITDEPQTIHIDLSTVPLARPGETLTVNYQTNQPSKIILYGVDEGILQVANYSTPDPLSFFFQKRALEVTTQQTVDQILPKFIFDRELSSAGGDGGDEAAQKLLNPFKRKTDLPVVFWSDIMDADSTSRQYTYTIPDYFNGALRIMAVAVAPSAVGSSSVSTQVRGDFVISPNVPTFVAPGDEFQISATIANNVKDSGAKLPVKIHLETTPGLQVIGSADQTINIDEGHEEPIQYKLKATDQLGSAKISFTANAAQKSSALSSTLSVRPATPYITTLKSGMNSSANLSLPLDRTLYPEQRDVNAIASSNPLILITGLQRYLDNYPYGCTEQLISKAMPLLALNTQATFATESEKVHAKADATIQMLAERQMSSGGFSYWPNEGDYASNTFASIYAMQFLTEANAQDIDVPRNILSSGISYLKEVAAQTPTSLEQARLTAYAIYILTRNEIVTTNYLTNLQTYLAQDKQNNWQHDITSAYLASTYALLKSTNEADRLIKLYDPKATVATGDFYSQTIANAQYLYLLAHHFPDLLPKMGADLILPLVQAMNSDQINTVSSAYISLALAAYTQHVSPANASDIAMSETLTSGAKQPLLADHSFTPANVDLLAKNIEINNPNKQAYFYQLTQSGFDKNIQSIPVQQGIEVYREYRDTKGNPLTQINIGDEVEVHVRLRAVGHDYLENIAVVDLLPGGFEIARDSLANINADYIDAREDRILFFTSASSDEKEFIYRIKATNKGHYLVPPILANSMYNPNILSYGISSNFDIV